MNAASASSRLNLWVSTSRTFTLPSEIWEMLAGKLAGLAS